MQLFRGSQKVQNQPPGGEKELVADAEQIHRQFDVVQDVALPLAQGGHHFSQMPGE